VGGGELVACEGVSVGCDGVLSCSCSEGIGLLTGGGVP
jgi:hypothetical protein